MQEFSATGSYSHLGFYLLLTVVKEHFYTYSALRELYLPKICYSYLIFINNFMNYLTNYYKNLCEDLQAKIDLLEAGLKQAIKTGDPKLLAKEGIKAGERFNRLQKQAGEHGAMAQQATKRFGPMSMQAKLHAGESEKASQQARNVMQNILDIDQQLDVEAPELRQSSTQKYVKQKNLEGQDDISGSDDQKTMHVTPSHY
jgi:hypothetical protein